MHREIQILLMTHGELGSELIRTASMFQPVTSSLMFIGLHENDAIRDYQKQMEALLQDDIDLLILSDMVSAATTRVAVQALVHGNVEVVSGVNLLMLINALREKDTHDLKQLSELVRDAGKEDIVNIRERLNEEE